MVSNVLKVDRPFMRKWIAALRSGKYKQRTGTLYAPATEAVPGLFPSPAKPAGYCCLGVAYTLKCKNKPKDGQGFLSDKMRCSIGLSTEQQDRLTNMNDSERKSFKQIAAHLERKFLKPKKKLG